MTTRTIRAWAVLMAVVVVILATVLGTGLALGAAGLVLISLALFLTRLDKLGKRGGTRR
jgi:hypothetical protein